MFAGKSVNVQLYAQIPQPTWWNRVLKERANNSIRDWYDNWSFISAVNDYDGVCVLTVWCDLIRRHDRHCSAATNLHIVGTSSPLFRVPEQLALLSAWSHGRRAPDVSVPEGRRLSIGVSPHAVGNVTHSQQQYCELQWLYLPLPDSDVISKGNLSYNDDRLRQKKSTHQLNNAH